MSRSPDAKEDPVECPLCMEPLEIDDINFFPCTCGYQICRFCWHRIRTDENGLCPACRKPYPEDPAVYKPLSQEELQRIKNEKKQKQNERKQKISENRKHLASVRVVQKNLVFVVGLSQRLADPEVLKRPEYFGKFGKIHKVVINNSTSYAGSQGPSASAYVTYIRSEDALRAIQCVNNVVVDGRTLKASLGTTKYCSYFLKNMQCPKPDCMYLHELGDEAASFTKEEMQAGKHQEYEQKLLQELYKLNPNFLQLSTGTVDKNKNKVTALQSPIDKPSDSLSIGNGDSSQQITNSDTPSPPPGLTKPNPAIPISSSNHSARSPFEGAVTESQSLFSDNFRHPNPIPSGLPPFPSSPQTSNDWPTAPEPQSLFTSETIPVSSSTDWQAAFGFGSSKQQEDDLGFDPFDVTRKALADLIEKELSVQDQPSLSPTSLQNPSPHTTAAKGPGSGFLHPAAPANANSLSSTFPVMPQRFPQFQQHRAVYNSFSFPGQAARYPWMAFPRNSIMHLNHTANPTSNSNFLDLNLQPQHSTGLGGIPISGIPASTGNSLDTLQDDNPPHWLKSLQALTEVDGPSAAPSQTHHSNPFGTQIPLHRASWNPYSPPSNPTSFHSPPPGFQTAFRPPSKTPTDLLQSSALDRH
ncbi:CCR4-NOT transcription complex subunit 4 isoform X7 [Centrocercus urophasianus]|uniref:CCR4-NOT transcription complex subunit 4 isoform X7 n=1 Tax=Centrocercus urophasianus TaxID=9002 RepID=UPI001C649D06|nr:CCR4-NOT transcription complex subunit 4 isoform X7 [Centrocercus urophasianus]XP_042745801.1 CCR4-NOT transcription complex subunit 4 isoform X5 [Lagopus leucura]XP_048796480.1 CCR4-NOT transcription complex subunit 4 isoform X4 [Lagopus muta]XP_052525441.1 CCR4-NOT transcription complex subunit 4 isoform X4 [Tympanuchus pallidicinctus]